MRKDVAAIEDESRLAHHVEDRLVVQVDELIPFGQHGDGMGSDNSFHGGVASSYQGLKIRHRLGVKVQGVVELLHHRLAQDLKQHDKTESIAINELTYRTLGS
jgi:hypothetical protein